MSRFPNLLLKNVIIPYKIDESLTPLISDNGISNNDITKLRNSLDLCFDGINDFYKLELTNYIESYISEIDVERTILEEKLELITKGLKKLIKNNPELDFNKENELKIIEKITSEETSVSLNKIILKYYIRQQSFLYDWVDSKRIILDNNLEEKIEQNIPKSKKPFAAKYYALFHWVLIEMGLEKNFERNINDRYKKNEIIAFAENRYKLNNGQGFYNAFRDGTIDMTKKTTIPIEFGKDYKETLILISNNDSKVISHLKKYPN